MNFQTQDKDRRAVGYWLLFMTVMVFLMVMVGGATRLTESGLSMVEWRPVTGMLPPLSAEAWQVEFSKYQQSPEYRLRNQGMSLDEFKGIFYWEWGHRLLGRLIGLFFAAPLAWFWFKKRIPHGYKPKLLALLVLGGMQGVLGWYMVMSGLVDEPAVSHYRLAAHLGLALFIMAALLWTALSLLNPEPEKNSPKLKAFTHTAMFILALQIIMGAFVAGLKAGLIYNQWPLMGEGFIPPGLLSLDPAWRNLLDNAVTVQFDHRVGAYILSVVTVLIFWHARGAAPRLKTASFFLLLAIALQMLLGIITLLFEVPVFWGTAHQGGGAVVLMVLVYLMHLQRKETAK